MDDPFNNYESIELAHMEQDPFVQNIKSNGIAIEEFVFYGGFRGPIKIWKVDYPEGTATREEFLRTSGEYAELDNLEFVE